MRIVPTTGDISPFYAEVIGTVAGDRLGWFLDTLYDVAALHAQQPEARFLVYVGVE
jgi:hypothetical protein